MTTILTSHATENLNSPAPSDRMTVTKSKNDKRNYQFTELENGLKLLTISDAEVQRAAVAVDVNVGSSAEPEAFPGLAHFLEHMLFLGTDQYPDADDYINYISDHGGNHNAFTAFDHTNYFFDIDPSYLHEGLKRFSRFFVAPLLLEKYVERERNAVDSEYQSKLQEDAWRNMDTLKQAVNPKHPYSRFSIGNNETLPNETVRPALMEFYQKYYSSDRMSVVIIGKEDNETLTQWGKKLFADVPKAEPVSLEISENLFDNVELPLLIENQSVKNEKNLSLYFQFPYNKDNEYSKSLGYLSYILGYEGEGSLLEALKKQGYASELYSGAGYRIGNETSFEIGVQLTDKGYKHTQNVVAMIFAYLELLRQDEQGERRYQEIATVAQTAFQFREKRNAMHEVSGLATRLNRYPVGDIQSLHAIFSGYNKAQIDGYLAQMTAENAIVQLTAPDIQSDRRTQYFDVPYRIKPLQVNELIHVSEVDKSAVQAMHLPKANPFIADNYQLQRESVSESNDVLENGIELFFKNDTSFRVPRSSVQISLQPTMDLSIADKTAMNLFASLIDEQLTTTLYDAAIAGVQVEVAAGEKSLAISLEGYQQKMLQLLTVILEQIQRADIDADIFAHVKANYRQDLENTVARMPYQQTFPYLNVTLTEDASLPEQRLAVLDSIDEESLAAIVKKAFAKLAVRMLVYGNDTYSDAEKLANTIPAILKETDFQYIWRMNRAKVIHTDEEKNFFVSHADNAITYYIQAGKGYAWRAKIGLLAKMLEPQFFTKLRTEMQLGYVVFAYPKPTFNQAGIAFTIQSPVANTDELQSHISDFNQQFAKSLSEMNESDFSDVKSILKGELLQKPENLMSAAGLYWADILTTGETISSRQAIANAIDEVELSEFIPQMQNVLTDGKRVVIKANPEKS